LARLRDDYAEFKSRGAEVLASARTAPLLSANIGPGESPVYRPARSGSQSGSSLQAGSQPFQIGRMPLVCVVDAQGLIRYAHYAVSMSDIPENKVLLAVIDELNASSK